MDKLEPYLINALGKIMLDNISQQAVIDVQAKQIEEYTKQINEQANELCDLKGKE